MEQEKQPASARKKETAARAVFDVIGGTRSEPGELIDKMAFQAFRQDEGTNSKKARARGHC